MIHCFIIQLFTHRNNTPEKIEKTGNKYERKSLCLFDCWVFICTVSTNGVAIACFIAVLQLKSATICESKKLYHRSHNRTHSFNNIIFHNRLFRTAIAASLAIALVHSSHRCVRIPFFGNCLSLSFSNILWEFDAIFLAHIQNNVESTLLLLKSFRLFGFFFLLLHLNQFIPSIKTLAITHIAAFTKSI